MSRTFTIETEVEVTFVPAGCVEEETAYPHIAITYTYSPARPAFTPRGKYAPIDPPEPAELEFVSSRLVKSDGLDPTPAQVEQWAQDYLDSEYGWNDATEYAESRCHPDPDDAYDRWRDDKMTGDWP